MQSLDNLPGASVAQFDQRLARYEGGVGSDDDARIVPRGLVEWRRLPLCHTNYQASLTSFLFEWAAKHIATFDRGLGRWAIPEPVAPVPVPEATAPPSLVLPMGRLADSAATLHHRDDALAKWRNIAS